jgi:purine-binding chemotaxis protein CheW
MEQKMAELIQDRAAPADAGSTAGPTQTTERSSRYLTFTLRGETYAVDILEVTEIIEFRSLTVVPMMPPFIRGVLNLRGRVLPVVDLLARFGRGETAVARRSGVIVIESRRDEPDPGAGEIGVMVDAVNKVVHLSAEDIQPPPAFGVGIDSDFISGMARYEGEFIVVLDLGRVLAIDDLTWLDPAPPPPPGR